MAVVVSALLRAEVRAFCPDLFSDAFVDAVCQTWAALYARIGLDEASQAADFRATMARRLEIGLVSFDADNVDEALSVDTAEGVS